LKNRFLLAKTIPKIGVSFLALSSLSFSHAAFLLSLSFHAEYYDVGPKDVTPLVMLHGTSGTAIMFFYQMLSLGYKGFRIISCQWPDYWTHEEWVQGFHNFLAAMKLKKVSCLSVCVTSSFWVCVIVLLPLLLLFRFICLAHLLEGKLSSSFFLSFSPSVVTSS
jgi:hypothetical protein